MTYIYIILLAFCLGLFALYQTLSEKNKNVKKDNFRRMKEQLLKLLDKDGYKSELVEGVILVSYRQEQFRIYFYESDFGDTYARVMIVDDYAMDGLDEVHPLILDNLMVRTMSRNPLVSNISFNDHCSCFYGTDVHDIKDFYRGLCPVLNSLIYNEDTVRQEFGKCRAEYGRKHNSEGKGHIGFKTSSEDQVDS